MELWQDEGLHACKNAGKDIGEPGCQVRGVVEVDAALENSKKIPVSGVYLYNVPVPRASGKIIQYDMIYLGGERGRCARAYVYFETRQ